MLASGTVLQDRYRVVRIIGHGGMGAVYEAVDIRLGTTIALKQTLFNDEELSRAFEREARLLAGLQHPALPRVSDHFIEGDGQFIVMEFIPGDDLAILLKTRGRPFECDQVLGWAYQLLDVLDFLHTRRPPITHRDIKPQNLKLSGAGRLILLDFGLAKGQPQLLDPATASSVFGYTLNYAPLEQIQNKGTDARSDLYSAGATLYQLMTGVVPPGSLSRAAAVASGEADPLLAANLVNPQVSSGIARAISTAMEFRPDRRFQSAATMRRALGEASWQPSSGHPVFGKVAAGAVSTLPVLEKVTVIPEAVTDLYEAPTRPIPVPQTDLALETVRIPRNLATRLGDGNSTLRSRWIWLLASVLTLVLFIMVFWSARPSQKLPAPGPEPPYVAVPIPPAVIPPAVELPAIPRAVRPPVDTISLDRVVWNENGTVTIYWSSVPGAINYRVETADQDLSKVRFLRRSDKSSCTVLSPRSDKSTHVRLTAIFRDGRKLVGRWFQIPTEQRPK